MADLGGAAEQAQIIAGGAAGAAARVYLRNPGTIVKAATMAVVCVALAAAFGTSAHHHLAAFGFNLPASGASVGLGGLTIVEGVIKGLEKIDFGGIFKRSKP